MGLMLLWFDEVLVCVFWISLLKTTANFCDVMANVLLCSRPEKSGFSQDYNYHRFLNDPYRCAVP